MSPQKIDYIDKKGWCVNNGFTTFTFSNRVYDKKECNIHYLPEPIKEVVKEKLLSYKPDPETPVGHMWYRDLDNIIPTLETYPDNYARSDKYHYSNPLYLNTSVACHGMKILACLADHAQQYVCEYCCTAHPYIAAR